MNAFRSLARARALPLLLAAGAAAAESVPPSFTTAFSPYTFTSSVAGGFWAVGDVSGRATYARYDDTGRFVRSFPYGYGSILSALPDGGVFLTDYSCRAERVDANGVQSWRNQPLRQPYYCPPAVVDAAGSTWIYGECSLGATSCPGAPRVVRLDTRGVVRASRDVLFNQQSPDGTPGPIAAATIGGGAWLGTGNGVVRVQPDGSYLGGWSQPNGARVTRIAVDPSDRAWAFVPTPASGETPSQLVLGLLTREGSLIRRTAANTLDRAVVYSAEANDTGAIALVADYTFSIGDIGNPIVTVRGLRLHRYETGGRVAWTRDFTPNEYCSECAATLAADGDTLVTYTLPSTTYPPPQRIVRLAPDGTVRSTIEPATAYSPRVQPDGNVLALRNRQGGGTAFVRYSPQGAELPAPATESVAQGQAELLGVHFERSGAAQVLGYDSTSARLQLVGYAPDGSIAWTRNLQDGVIVGLQFFSRVVGNGRTSCWAAMTGYNQQTNIGELTAECFDPATGVPRFRRTIAEDYLSFRFELVLTADDTLVVGHDTSDRSVRVSSYSATGTQVASTVQSGYNETIAAGDRGDILLRDDQGRRMTLVGADGALRWVFRLQESEYPAIGAVSAQGGAAIITRTFTSGSSFPRLVLLSPLGFETRRWELGALGSGYTLAFIGNDVLLGELRTNDSFTVSSRQVARYSSDRDSPAWTWRSDDRASNQLQLAVDASTQSIAFGTISDQRGRIATLDATTGDARIDRVVPCDNSYCRLAALSIDSSGGARYANSQYYDSDRPGGARWRLRSVPARGPALRLDQQGIAGAWYPDYAAGQGLFLEWLPGSSTLFSTWFAYATGQGNDPAALQWYSLQGVLPAGATRGNLVIYANSGGTFASPPATQAVRVGSAVLELEDCGRAALDYAFETGANAGQRGRYSLTRITDPRAGCAGATMRPPAGGFDAAQSGAWFAPETSGQGVVLSIEPGATLFGAWFTFDPAGASDDATAQHWFTLQGSLANASGGRVVLPIYSTIGGDFDRAPTGNSVAIGEATLTLTACDRLTLDFRFDTPEKAGAYAGRTGSLALQRIGGCAQ